MDWKKADLFSRRLFVASGYGLMICCVFYLALTVGMTAVWWAIMFKSPNYRAVGWMAGTGAFLAGVGGLKTVMDFLTRHLLPPAEEKK